MKYVIAALALGILCYGMWLPGIYLGIWFTSMSGFLGAISVTLFLDERGA